VIFTRRFDGDNIVVRCDARVMGHFSPEGCGASRVPVIRPADEDSHPPAPVRILVKDGVKLAEPIEVPIG
jgi:hypothetical protein